MFTDSRASQTFSRGRGRCFRLTLLCFSSECGIFVRFEGDEPSQEFLFCNGRRARRARGFHAGRTQEDRCPVATFARIEKGIRGRKILPATCAATAIIAYARVTRAAPRSFVRSRSLACSRSLMVDPRTPGGFWPVTFTYTGLTFSARPSCNSRAAALGIGRARRYDDGTFIREAAHKCQENQPNSWAPCYAEGKKGGEISWDSVETSCPGRSRIDRSPREYPRVDDCDSTESNISKRERRARCDIWKSRRRYLLSSIMNVFSWIRETYL